MLACKCGHAHVVDFIIAKGFYITVFGNDGLNGLALAHVKGHYDICILFQENNCKQIYVYVMVLYHLVMFDVFLVAMSQYDHIAKGFTFNVFALSDSTSTTND